jgi:peptidoglycan/xylan/chitin deacetylase (PgdA/CDA1 family)
MPDPDHHSGPVRSWSALRTRSPRDAARDAALGLLARAYGMTGLLRKGLETPRIHFLYLHHVFEDEETEFRALVAHVAERHRLVGYSEAVERVLEGRVDDTYVCFSFDDGVESCLRAARVLEEFDARGCFFVLPSIVGETDPARLEAFCRTSLRAAPFEFMNWAQIEELARSGHEIGSHTLTHPCVADLTPERMQDEIFGSRDEIVRRLGEVRHFAWPFGGFEHFHPAAARLVFEAGYRSCASAVRGCHVAAPRHPADLCIRRENTFSCWPRAHVDYFMARSALEAGAADNEWPAEWNLEPAGPTGDDTCASPS